MESKTKHRILGILVIVGLGVLIYPLLQSSKDMPNEQVLVKAPPFPDQASPLNAGPTPTVDNESAKVPEAATPIATDTMPDSTNSAENVAPDDMMRQQPDDTIAPTTPGVVNVKAPTISSEPDTTAPEADNQEAVTPQPAEKPETKSLPGDTSSSENITAPEPKIKASHTKIAKKASVKSKTLAAVKPKTVLSSATKAFVMPKQDDQNGLLKLNQTAWVIQVGSFKQKAEAMRLVNQLRGNGYRAFIQQLPSEQGNSTQVFVGPEHRQTLARALATQLQNDMQVKGIVVSYQPFAL